MFDLEESLSCLKLSVKDEYMKIDHEITRLISTVSGGNTGRTLANKIEQVYPISQRK